MLLLLYSIDLEESTILQLVVMFKKDQFRIRHLVRRAAVLPLVPENSVDDFWFLALEDNQNDSPHEMRFKDYVTETWVEGHLQHWNQCVNHRPRTTNSVEGWHHELNVMCRRQHPNINTSSFKHCKK